MFDSVTAMIGTSGLSEDRLANFGTGQPLGHASALLLDKDLLDQ
jgi:hypothetical protein